MLPTCGGTAEGDTLWGLPRRLGIDNIYGLLMITAGVLVIGVAIGFMEQIIALIMHFCPCGGAEEEEDPEKDEQALDDEFREIQARPTPGRQSVSHHGQAVCISIENVCGVTHATSAQGMDAANSDEVVQKVSALKERLVAFEKMMSAQDDQGEVRHLFLHPENC
jgi:hypothetical protein